VLGTINSHSPARQASPRPSHVGSDLQREQDAFHQRQVEEARRVLAEAERRMYESQQATLAAERAAIVDAQAAAADASRAFLSGSRQQVEDTSRGSRMRMPPSTLT
jgi:glutathione S-transferase